MDNPLLKGGCNRTPVELTHDGWTFALVVLLGACLIFGSLACKSCPVLNPAGSLKRSIPTL